jgi:hypothetical protein
MTRPKPKGTPAPRAKGTRDTGPAGTRGGSPVETGPADVYLRDTLLALIQDPTTPPVAKASVIRTLAEIDGLVGRHQMAPDRGQDTPVQELSRADLVAELERLRALVLRDAAPIQG